MESSLEYRDLYVRELDSFILLKKAPFIWNEKVVEEIRRRKIEFKNPMEKILWLTKISHLDWSKYEDKNLKPLISHLHRCAQWAFLHNLTQEEKKNLIRREFDHFYSKPRFPFDPLLPNFGNSTGVIE